MATITGSVLEEIGSFYRAPFIDRFPWAQPLRLRCRLDNGRHAPLAYFHQRIGTIGMNLFLF